MYSNVTVVYHDMNYSSNYDWLLYKNILNNYLISYQTNRYNKTLDI